MNVEYHLGGRLGKIQMHFDGDKLDGTNEGKILGKCFTGGKPCAIKGMYLVVAHLQLFCNICHSRCYDFDQIVMISTNATDSCTTYPREEIHHFLLSHVSILNPPTPQSDTPITFHITIFR